MIVDAIHKGCRRFIMGIGGSATNDGGVGMLQALGYDFLDKDGNQIKHGAIGLKDLVQIKDDKAISLGTAGGTPHKGEYLCARAGVVRRKGGCRRSRCDLLFHRPVDGFGKIIVRLYIGKAGTHGRIIR